MRGVAEEIRKKRRVAIDAALLFVVILLVTQMWLLTATLESYLAGHKETALPGLIVSAVLFLASFAIHRFVARLDRAPEPKAEDSRAFGPWDIN